MGIFGNSYYNWTHTQKKMKNTVLYTISVVLLGSLHLAAAGCEREEATLFDFTSEEFTQDDLEPWYEISDPARVPGKSKGAFTLQKTQRLVFFALLNPQPNGACFAGMSINRTLQEFGDYNGFTLKVRAQGLKGWKMVVKMVEDDGSFGLVDYELKFQMDTESEEFEIVTLPTQDFQAFYQGQLVEDQPPLDLSMVGRMGLQTFGGFYDGTLQRGPGTLEVDYIRLY